MKHERRVRKVRSPTDPLQEINIGALMSTYRIRTRSPNRIAHIERLRGRISSYAPFEQKISYVNNNTFAMVREIKDKSQLDSLSRFQSFSVFPT